MSSLTIAWEYLTGYAVAMDPSTRDRAEWPPHPARVFMALAAAWFETQPSLPNSELPGDCAAEQDALRWLETLGDPEMVLPLVERRFERSNVTVYVPVNDRAGPSAATIQSSPAMSRTKQPRTFPRIWVGNEPCFLHWPNANATEAQRTALDRLCRKVTRLGHSSSLVQMWVAADVTLESCKGERLVPDELGAQTQARSLSEGTLNMLRDRFGEDLRGNHAALSREIEALKAEKKNLAGKGARERKTAIDAEIAERESQLAGIVLHPPVRPTIGLWSGYRRVDDRMTAPDVGQGLFDPDILVLSQVEGQGASLPLESTLTVTKALRDTIMSESGIQPVPAWVSGHLAGGQPLRDGNAHLALIPLPFVGRPDADGHLLGLGLVFPRSLERAERGQVLGKLLVDETSRGSRPVTLKLGRLGVWCVAMPHWSEERRALQPEQWTALPKGSDTWASVTPIVLDRFPKADRRNPAERPAWEEEVQQIVRDSCTRGGLPEPEWIEINTTGWHLGSPRAVVKRRPLRGQTGSRGATDAALGDGFPPFPAKGTNASRPQIHVRLHFAQPVIGPLLLGAGRFLGYGLCKPWKEDRR